MQSSLEEKRKVCNMAKWECRICGYIYDDEKKKPPFKELPEDWRCPECYAPKSYFIKME